MDIKEVKEALSEVVGEVVKTTLPEMVKEAVGEQMKALKVDRKNILDPEDEGGEKPNDEGEPPVEGKAKIQKFINAVTAKDRKTVESIVSQKALVGGTNTAGGYLVPEEFQAELIRIAEDFGLVRRLSRRIPMGSDTRNIPRLSSSVTVYWPGENTAGTPSEPVFGQVQLLAKTCVGLTVVSNELLEDSNPEISGILLELFAEAIAGEEDAQGLAGTGAPFTGVLSDTNVTTMTMAGGDTSFADITADYLRDMIAQLKPLALSGAGFFMHRSVWSRVQKLKDGSGAYIATTANPFIGATGATTGIVGYVWGYPVYLSEKMPFTDAVSTKFIIFGNLRYLYLGDRRNITFAVSDSATVGSDNVFEQNSSAVRVTERIALAVAIPTAFCVLRTAAS